MSGLLDGVKCLMSLILKLILPLAVSITLLWYFVLQRFTVNENRMKIILNFIIFKNEIMSFVKSFVV